MTKPIHFLRVSPLNFFEQKKFLSKKVLSSFFNPNLGGGGGVGGKITPSTLLVFL